MSDGVFIEALVVDDETSLLEELKDFLSFQSVSVHLAANGIQALEQLAAHPGVTVVLTDIRMPSLDGLTLASRIVQAHGDANAVEVVLMTGHGTIETAAEAVRAGAFDFLRKPMELDDVIVVLRRAHARAIARRDAYSTRMAEMSRLRADYADLQDRFARVANPIDLTSDAPPVLAHILAHELRAPLMPLLSLPSILSDQQSLPAGMLNSYLRDVRKSGEQLKDIADDLIELLAPPREDSFVWQEVSLGRLLASLEMLSLPAARDSKITLLRSVQTDGAVETCEAHLLAALWRLINHAIKATPPGGQVKLSVQEAQRSMIAFAVHNDGRGMTEAEIQSAKLPFHQLDPALSRRVEGMGLGIALANRMAQRLGGHLDIVSPATGGTTASIVLPRARAQRAPR
jgi:signal transduction histidine kinase